MESLLEYTKSLQKEMRCSCESENSKKLEAKSPIVGPANMASNIEYS